MAMKNRQPEFASQNSLEVVGGIWENTKSFRSVDTRQSDLIIESLCRLAKSVSMSTVGVDSFEIETACCRVSHLLAMV